MTGHDPAFDGSRPGYRLLTGHDPTIDGLRPGPRLGQEVSHNSQIESGRAKRCSIPHASDRIELRGFEISRFGSGRVGSGRVGLGRVGSGRGGSGRVGSGRVVSGRVGSGRVGSGRVKKVPGPVDQKFSLVGSGRVRQDMSQS